MNAPCVRPTAISRPVSTWDQQQATLIPLPFPPTPPPSIPHLGIQVKLCQAELACLQCIAEAGHLLPERLGGHRLQQAGLRQEGQV